MNDREFWYFLLQGAYSEQQGACGIFYAYGEHCGDALAKVLHHANEQGLSNSVPLETNRLDVIEEFELPEEAEELAEGIFFKPPFYTFPVEDLQSENYFVCPVGILSSSENDDEEYDLIIEGFTAYDKNENGIYELELVLNRENLVYTLFKAIDLLPSVDGFWIYIKQHWENQQTELWACPAICDKKSAVDFLKKNQNLTIENGFLDCVVHSISGQTNLTLDDHKKILLHTKDEDLLNKFFEGIINLGFEQKFDLPNIEYGYYHWHYRPVNSLGIDDFRHFLELENFELLDYWEE